MQWLDIPNLWQYVTVPIVAAFVGWFTNWIAILLTFYPIRFIGIPPYLGWQGIIPSKADRMARISVDASLAKIGTPRDVFAEMDPALMKDHFVRTLTPWSEWYVKDVLFETYPRLWKVLPEFAKKAIFTRVADHLPEVVEQIMGDLTDNIDEVLDLKWLAVRELSQDPKLLVRIFQECGEQEFKFIINSGIYFGFLFGIVQAIAWYLYPANWTLPAFGVLVGTATNWIALKIIFSPLQPIKIGPFTLQGLFLKRQKEVARVYCRIITNEILTMPNIADTLMNGPNAERMHEIIGDRVNTSIDEAIQRTPEVAEFVRIAGGNLKIDKVKRSLSNKAISMFSGPFNDSAFAKGRQEVVEDLLYSRMIEMTPQEFQDLLRPAFQEDEAKLVAAGAVLGALAGAVQMVIYLL